MNLSNRSSGRIVGLSSTFALLALLGMAFFCPSINDAAHATNDDAEATFEKDVIMGKTEAIAALKEMLAEQEMSTPTVDDLYVPEIDQDYVVTDEMMYDEGIDAAAITNEYGLDLQSDDGIMAASVEPVNASASFTVNFLLASKLRLELDDIPGEVRRTVTPISADSQLVHAEVPFTAYSNSSNGVIVSISASQEDENGTAKTTDTSLMTTGGKQIKSIAFGSSKSLSEFDAGYWGVNLKAQNITAGDTTGVNWCDGSDFQSIKFTGISAKPSKFGSSTPVNTNTNPTSGKYCLTLGAKVDLTVDPGVYQKKINISVLPNPTDTTVINSVLKDS